MLETNAMLMMLLKILRINKTELRSLKDYWNGSAENIKGERHPKTNWNYNDSSKTIYKRNVK